MISKKNKTRNDPISPPKFLALGFSAIILTGTFLLELPMATADGTRTSLADAFFTAVSATSVTGLVVVDTGTHWSTFGQIVLLLLFQLGGLGFMTSATWIAMMLNRRISFRERMILQEAMGQYQIQGIVDLIRKVLVYAFTIEGIGALLLTLRFWRDMHFDEALYLGIFQSVSIFNNAGFDLLGSIHGPFAGFPVYGTDIYLNLVNMALIFLGGIGFIVMFDVMEYPKCRKLSLHSKVVLSVTGFLILLGALSLFLLEYSNDATIGNMTWGEKWMAAFFQSITARSGGISTIDIGSMQQSSQFFLIILMFIGAAPGSTGGGIKVTTFAVLIGAVISMIQGKRDVVLFKKRIPEAMVYRSLTVTIIALIVLVSSAMFLSATEDQQFLVIFFEAVSAFGTVGLSMGMTPELSEVGKVFVALLMFLGRLGPLTLAYALTRKKHKDLYRHPEGRIIIG
ncbi:Trk family potassium uptake protein [Paenibacillus sp. F411]|uniref:TrkH family potassium uptake protein n=1 Tax=Paenibacillus algicola TaxID=2565926 RepID=A0A4P8XJM1_9BACL|nr:MULTISPECIES: TrkH family potassium uptake protein [Paenibacillus]MBO2942947.1 Trk family potassium uptake protein [Paenibacillus sp. F411]QCT02852.1 TrkH family potassium uptake protein [Paenibacillus algicola]